MLLTRKRRAPTFSSRRMFLTLAKWLRRTTRRLCNVEDFQWWRRGLGIIWTSALLRADGRTLRIRFAADLMRRARNCEADALRLCNIASGRGRTSPEPRSRVGLPLPAAWEVIGVGEFLWWKE